MTVGLTRQPHRTPRLPLLLHSSLTGAGSVNWIVDTMHRVISIFVLAAVLIPSVAHAKRKAPPKVEPVVYDGVRYTAPNDDGRHAYVQAWQTSTNRMLWEVTVLRNRINPLAEEDVQHVYISQMRIRDGKLIVMIEDGRAFSVDLKTRAVEKLEKAPKKTRP